jgi:hypothetical protein
MLGLGGVGATHGDIGAVIDSLEFDGVIMIQDVLWGAFS